MVALFRVQYAVDCTDWLKIALWATSVTPVLEFLQQARNVCVVFVKSNDGAVKTVLEIPIDKTAMMDALCEKIAGDETDPSDDGCEDDPTRS